jgi:hypothetical protein
MKTTVQLRLTAEYKNPLTGAVATPIANLIAELAATLDNGTGADQANQPWASFSRTVASGSPTDIDFYDLGSLDIGAGAGKDPLGQSFTNAELVALFVKNDDNSAANLLVGGNGTTACFNSMFNSDDDGTLVIMPGGGFLIFAPTNPAYAIADTSNHLLRFASASGTITYHVLAIFRNA